MSAMHAGLLLGALGLTSAASVEVRGLVDEFGDVALAHFARSLSSSDPADAGSCVVSRAVSSHLR
jgi:hypothetical protein